MSSVEVVVIRAATADVDLRCGGVPMREAQASSGTDGADGSPEGSVELGKRYVDDDDTVEVLCSKPGAGTLSIGDQALVLKSAKPLPASD